MDPQSTSRVIPSREENARSGSGTEGPHSNALTRRVNLCAPQDWCAVPRSARDDSELFLTDIGRPRMSAKDHTFTLGIEEEFAIIDPETRELRSHIQEILEGGKVTLKEQIKPEMHQSVVELGTEICQSVVDARAHVIELRSRLAGLAGRSGFKIASVGTHPFSHWRDQLITQGERYKEIVEGHAAARARQPHLRIARACRNSGSRDAPSTS